MRFFLSCKRGFTLIEIMVAVAIIGILVSVIYVGLDEMREKARDAQRMSDLQQVQLALRQYKDIHSSDVNKYPNYPNGTKLSALMKDYDGDSGNGIGGELEQFFPSVLADPLDTSPLDDFAPENTPTSNVYLYDSNFECDGTPRAVLIALSMEQSVNANWQSVAIDECKTPDGGLIGDAMNGYNVTGGDDTYILILR